VRVALPAVLGALVVGALASTVAVPTMRASAIGALHLGDASDRTGGVAPDGRVAGQPKLRIAVQPAPPPPALTAREINIDATGFVSWALMDRESGRIAGSPGDTSDRNSTESMIKSWLSADYLRLLGGRKPSAQRLAELSRMIRDSDDAAAEDIYQVDGRNSVIKRMITICGMTDSSVFSGWWSKTQVTARDAVRLGACVADGRAAGPTWTPWVLDEMRQTRGTVAQQPGGGRWGIIDALPPDVAAQTSIKNGWTLLYDDGRWHLNCLAIHRDWILAVLTRYPGSLGKQYGAGVCANVTRQLLTNR
jgi:hypothetical protein